MSLFGAFFEELDDALTEAILSAELSKSERQQWQKKLKNWQKEVDGYGIDGFAMSLVAIEQEWDYPPLQRVLQGEITELGVWENEAPDFADDLARIRLKILERQGRHQEYLYLAEAEGQIDRYLQMLTKLGRSQEAVVLAEQEMSTAGEAWTLAQALREQGELEQALKIAMQGLSLDGHHYQLAVWTSELAEGMDQELALQARLKAFQLQPSLPDYLKLKELAVMDAVIAHRPDWVIENARPRAESIITAAQAQYYHHAINWLRRVRAAYLQLGQQEKWDRYRTALVQAHFRKHKLISMLQQRDLT